MLPPLRSCPQQKTRNQKQHTHTQRWIKEKKESDVEVALRWPRRGERIKGEEKRAVNREEVTRQATQPHTHTQTGKKENTIAGVMCTEGDWGGKGALLAESFVSSCRAALEPMQVERRKERTNARLASSRRFCVRRCA